MSGLNRDETEDEERVPDGDDCGDTDNLYEVDDSSKVREVLDQLSIPALICFAGALAVGKVAGKLKESVEKIMEGLSNK